MPQYSYSARNEDGTPLQGTIDAISIQAAQEALKGMHLQPEQIFESQPHADQLHMQETHSAWTTTEEKNQAPLGTPGLVPSHLPPLQKKKRSYFPVVDTLRLYAGWLIAWYAVIYALGNYQKVRPLPFRIPYAEALLLSPLVLSFCLASFLFLLASTIHSSLGKKTLQGFFTYGVAVCVFLVYRMNVV